jgi:hypothetical protein
MESQAYRRLRLQVAKYLVGDLALHDLEDESLAVICNHHGDAEALDLAGTIQVLVSELALGDRSVESLRSELAGAIRPVGVPQ